MVTPTVERLGKFPDGSVKLDLHLPYCCFPAYRTDGKPSQVRVLKPDHPIASGLPSAFEIPQEEMYDEQFRAPEADEILEERMADGRVRFRKQDGLDDRQGELGLLLPTGVASMRHFPSTSSRCR